MWRLLFPRSRGPSEAPCTAAHGTATTHHDGVPITSFQPKTLHTDCQHHRKRLPVSQDT